MFSSFSKRMDDSPSRVTRTRDSTELLIDMVHSNRALWDSTDARFRIAPLKMQIFSDIGQALGGIDGITVQSKWRNIKDRYVKEKKKPYPGTGAKCRRPWVHMEKLSFLDPVVKIIPTFTSMNLPSMSDMEYVCESPLVYSCTDNLSVEIREDSLSREESSGGDNDLSNNDHPETSTSSGLSSMPSLADSRKKRLRSTKGCVGKPMSADEMFCMSMVDALTRLEPRTKAKLKCDFTRLLYEAEFPNDATDKTPDLHLLTGDIL